MNTTSATDDQGLVWQGPQSERWLLDWQECWRYRDLLWVFVGRDLKVRYRQALVGVAWVLLQPLALTAVAAFYFNGNDQTPPVTPGVNYTISALCGFIIYQLFQNGVRDATGSVVAARAMLTKIYFPRIFLPATPVLCATFDCLVACSLFVPLMIWQHVVPGPRLLLLPLMILWAMLVTTAFAIGLSALNAFYRDVGYAVPFFLQIGQFVSSTLYETIPFGLEHKWWYGLNPIVAVIDGFRWSLIPACPPPVLTHTIGSLGVTSVVLIASLRHFQKTESILADRV